MVSQTSVDQSAHGSKNNAGPAATLTYSRRPSILVNYFWLVVRNVVGWILIFASWALGLLSPIPIGFFLFLIGFGLIWFPGKRGLTVRVLRGAPIAENSRAFMISLTIATVAVPTILVIWLNKAFHFPYHLKSITGLIFGSLFFAGAVTTLFLCADTNCDESCTGHDAQGSPPCAAVAS